MLRNYFKDWFAIFPIKSVYDHSNKTGNFDQWKGILLKDLGDRYKHPITVVLLEHVSITKFLRKIEKEFVKFDTDSYGSSLGKWIRNDIRKFKYGE